MGGKVAQLIAGRNKFPNLKALILVAPAPPTPLILPDEMRAQQRVAYETRESSEFVVRNVLTSTVLRDAVVDGLVVDMLRGNEHARKAWPEYGMAEDISEVVKGVDCPVLVLAGEKDRVESKERLEKEVLGRLRQARMSVVEGAGHLVMVEAPAKVARVVEEFISSVA